jgi:hypothetical protein
LFGSTYISSLAIQVATCLITRISLAPFTTAGLSPRSSPDYAAPLTAAESSVSSSRWLFLATALTTCIESSFIVPVYHVARLVSSFIPSWLPRGSWGCY